MQIEACSKHFGTYKPYYLSMARW